jgi:hypothetical protein
MFAEIFYDTKNQRVFKVAVQGKDINGSLDFIALAGADNAYTLTTNATLSLDATDIRIEFTNVIENAKISAIEIIPGTTFVGPQLQAQVPKPVPAPVPNPPSPVPTPIQLAPAPVVDLRPTTGEAIRINAGSFKSWKDPVTGNVWAADVYYKGGSTTDMCPLDISSTNLDTLYCSFFIGSPNTVAGSYEIPVPGTGQYAVRLMFSENLYMEPNKRNF